MRWRPKMSRGDTENSPIHHLFNYILILLLPCILCSHLSIACVFNGYDLKDLQEFSPWETVNDFTNATYTISLCKKLENADNLGCSDGSSVCTKYPNGTTINYGNYSDNPVISKTGSQDGELMLLYSGQACPDFQGEHYSSIFYFKCGKTMGHPYHLGDLGCSVHFEWESYVFCKDFHAPEKEVPCTVMKDGHLIDLSPLTKLTGGHLVDEAHNRKIYINVCRDIKAGTGTDEGTSSCPAGAAVCRIVDSKAANFGKPVKRLESSTNGVKLVYESSVDVAGCAGKPKTMINFECPQRGGSKDPVLISDFLCTYEIQWVTEYACPVDHITSKTCQLTSSQHDVDIDLTPLKHAKFSPHPYLVNVTEKNDHYRYYINMCDGLGFQCGHASASLASVCQKKDDDDTYSRNLGEMTHTRLMYSDGELVMKFRNGDLCHTNIRRTTLINFHCNISAENDGVGYPVYEGESECTYTFSWDTKYACLDHPVDASCRVEANGKRFDLSTLVKEHGENWEVLVSENYGETFYVNVCHDVLRKDVTAGCPQGSAMCAYSKDDGYKNLGKYVKNLQYDEKSKSLKLEYTDGDKIDGGCARKTSINFFCLPGVLDSAPKLVHKSEDGCYYELEWHTAAACTLSHKTGGDCKVYDDDAGYHFDLSPLKKDDGFYSVSADGYTYYINVCDEVKGKTPCDAAPHSNAAVCQVKDTDNTQIKKIGEPTSLVEYFDGVLNLTYYNGEPYNNDAKTKRMTEIAFLCDPSADKGSPQFLIEKDYTYAFEWRTSQACPVTPVECLVTDPVTNKQVDLSSLSKGQDNWVVMDDGDPNSKKKFYINVCQPLAKVKGDHCSSFAAVCATKLDQNGKESLFHANLGRAEQPPTIEKSTNGVKLLYTNGNDCVDNGVKKKFVTSLHIICVKGKVNGQPLTPKLIRPCEYSLIWETSAACPVDHVTPATTDDGDKSGSTKPEGSCSIKDPNSDFTFNLMPLYKRNGEVYEVKSADGKKTYKFNICGDVGSTCGKFDGSKPTAVCDGQTPLAALSKDVTYSSAGDLSLVYKGKTNVDAGWEKTYSLSFYCSLKAQEPEISLAREELYNTNIRVYTALACPPKPVECEVVDDKGHRYDLSPLAREDKNWVVIDPRPSHSNLHYHINVCRPVISTAEMTCPGGAVGGCQTGDKSYNMGYVQSKPVVASGGRAITIVYQGGDKCHEGKDMEAFRSTRITFTCSAVEHSPVFESESENCEYRFIWRTPSACPQHRVIGSQCKVKEPLYDFEFDLSPLRKSKVNYKVSGDVYDFYLNVCGPLVASSNLCSGDNIGSCQTGSSLEHPVEGGMGNDKLIYDGGELSLVYSDGKANCHGKFNRTTVIQFLCDHSKDGTDGPRYIQETATCTYMFEWPTSHACPPHEVIDCTFEHGNQVFDLSRLSLADSNYDKQYNQSDKMYIINICRSLVHKKGQTCPFNSAACEIDISETDEKKKFHSLGQIKGMTLSYDDKSNLLTLLYSNGEMCSDGKTHRSTKILFDCDKNSNALGTIRSHVQSNGCEDSFFWTSSAACPVVKDDTDKSMHVGDCKVKNPQTGYEFDLSRLKNSGGYKTFDREGHMFELNVCNSLSNKKDCPDGTGSCQTKIIDPSNKGINAGKFNSNLKFRDGVLVLEYTDGDTCHTGGTHHATFINFVCSPGSAKGVPVYVDKSGDCEYNFDWHTDLACETQIECSVKTDKGMDLDFSPLVRRSGKYNVLSNVGEDNKVGGMVYINLCRPLNPVFGTLCPPGSGACLVRNGVKPLSLGHVHDGLTYDKVTKEAKLSYTHGDPCPSNLHINSSSLIILKCHKGRGLEPELDRVTSDCQYIFTWLTPYACESSGPSEFSNTCKFYDKNTATTFDLSQLSNTVTVKDSGHTFSLKPCGHLEDKGEMGDASCKDASVCDKSGSFGRFDKATASKNFYTLDLKYKNGRSCKIPGRSMKASSTIMFKCDPTAGHGTPSVLEVNECDVSFLWETSLVCPRERKECAIGHGGDMFDFNFLAQDSGSWNYTDSKKNVYWLNLCQSLRGPTVSSKCKKNAAICMKSHDGTVSMLGDVDTQVIKGGNVQYEWDFCVVIQTTLYPQGVLWPAPCPAVGNTELDNFGSGRNGKQVISLLCPYLEWHKERHILEDASKDSQSILIQYSQGDMSVCSKGRRRRRDLQPTVSIHLKCADTLGAPVLKKDKLDSKECIFEFEWNTRIACPVGKNPKEVEVKDSKILDSRSGHTLNLKPLLQTDIRPSFSIGGKQYSINLLGQQPSDTGDKGTKVCQGAAVCQKSEKTQQYRNLGSFLHSAYYVKDEKLEVVFTSPDMCTGKNKNINVSSTILFHCAKGANKNDLELLYHTSDCAYIFTWDTSIVCLEAAPSNTPSGHDATGKKNPVNPTSTADSSSASKIAIGVSIVVGIAFICILILILHRPERRASVKSKLKSCMPCGKGIESPFVYSKLSSSADDAELTLDDDPFNPFNEPDEEAEINNGQLPAQVHSFHDDSDDDLLL